MCSLFHLNFMIFSDYCRLEYIDQCQQLYVEPVIADDVLCSVGFRKCFFWKELLSTLAQFWRTDENNRHQQRYFTLFHVVPSEGGAERPLNSWPCYIFNLLIPAICHTHTRVLKCKMQGLGNPNFYTLSPGPHRDYL